MSRKQKSNVKKKKRCNQEKKLATVIICTFILLVAGIFLSKGMANAHDSREEDPVNFKYYKGIEVGASETLSDIADKYALKECCTKREYMNEIMKINDMDSIVVKEGMHLTIVYYDTEFK